jgi:hypothetical protein
MVLGGSLNQLLILFIAFAPFYYSHTGRLRPSSLCLQWTLVSTNPYLISPHVTERNTSPFHIQDSEHLNYRLKRGKPKFGGTLFIKTSK